MAQILIADDDKFIRDYLGGALRRESYNIRVVESGSAATKMVLKKKFDVLILDIHMAGISGLETIPLIKKIRPDLPIIVITGNTSEEMERKVRTQGIFYYFIKPFEIEEMKQVIKSALKERR